MSIPVELSALAERIEEFGPVAYLMSVGAEDRPHVVSVRVAWDGPVLVVGAGQRTSGNVEARPEVTLLWPAPPQSGYCLIVDGRARSVSDEAEPRLAITPSAAVLHRTPEGDPASPSCVTILPRS